MQQQQQQQKQEQQTFGRQTADVFHVGARIWVPQRSVRRQSSRSDGLLVAASNAIFRNTENRDWVAGEVKRVDSGAKEDVILTVEIAESKQIVRIDTDGCYLQNEEDVADLVDSDFLHEPGVLSTLKVRYQKDEIYTFSGTILIAVNPHRPCPYLYTKKQMNLYHSKTLGEQPPHVYAIAEHAFQSMLIENQRQAILISGESGAGKTESAKMVMQYLAHRAKQDNGFIKNGTHTSTSRSGSFEGSRPIEEQVLESNPLLEAFGNAKTMRNNNSSRFGKFVEMSFDDYGFVRGASIAVFLLERSRVVSINDPERSYHIFYQLTKGATQHQQQKYRLKSPEQFRYLAQSNSFSLGDRDDIEEFRKTMEAMRIVGLTEREQDSVLRIVAAILHLGDVTFSAEDQDSLTHLANTHAEQAAQNCADLLEVDVEILKKGLLSRSIDTPHGRIHKPLNKFGAEESRDALSKTLYSQLFDWLVGAINRKIHMLGSGERRPHTIGILDIYGFESFESNSFEQLCINLANERLQQQFNRHVLQGEQQQYINEGIKWSYVEFIDNQDCLDLLEGSKSNPRQGIFPLIDEACRLPNVTNNDLSISMRTQLKQMTRFEVPKRDQSAFTIDHYAGKVHYTTDQLIEKNRDYIVEEHTSIISSSANELIRSLGDLQENNVELNKRSLQRSSSSRGSLSAFKLTSVGYRFRRQLQDLSNTLSECQPLYIRCIKPNPQSQPGEFVFPFVLGQLHALGVLVAVRIACAGFPTRKTYGTFVQRYYMLTRYQTKLKSINQNDINECKACTVRILQHMEIEGFQTGKNKIFLRAGQLAILEAARGRLLNISATQIQAYYKSHQAVKRYQQVRRYIIVIQSCFRGFKGRQLAQQIRRERSALKIQSCYRGYVARQKYRRIISAVRIQRAFRRFQMAKVLRRENAAITIQKWYRRYKAQQYVMHLICAMIIQKWYKRYIAMKHFRQLKAVIRLQRAWRRWLLRLGFYTDRLKVEHGLAEKASVVSRSRGRRSLRGTSTKGSTHGDAWSMVSGEDQDNRAELHATKLMQLDKAYKEAMLEVQDVQQQFESDKINLEIEVDKWKVGYHSALAEVRSLQYEMDTIKNSLNQGVTTATSSLGANFVYPDDIETEDSSSIHPQPPPTPTPQPPGKADSSLDSTQTTQQFSQDQQAAVMALITGTTSDFLPIKPVQKTSCHFPVSSWILFRSFIHMNKNWRPESMHNAAQRLQINFKSEMQQALELEHRFYWWSVVLALAGALSVQSKVSVAQYGLSRVANMVLFVPVFHQALGKKIRDQLWGKVSITDLIQVHGSQNAWKQLSGNIEFIFDMMQKIKIPMLGIKAVIRAIIQHIAAELLNSLLRTPEYCANGSLRAIKDGQRKVNLGIDGFMDSEEGDPDYKAGWGPLNEAIQLILQGKDELVRLNTHTMDPIPALTRICPSLSMGQVITLLEQGHDERESQRGASVLRNKLSDLILKLKKGGAFEEGEDDLTSGPSLLLDSTKPFRFGCGSSEDDAEARKLVTSAAKMYASVGFTELGTAFENVELPPVILQNATLRSMFILRV